MQWMIANLGWEGGLCYCGVEVWRGGSQRRKLEKVIKWGEKSKREG